MEVHGFISAPDSTSWMAWLMVVTLLSLVLIIRNNRVGVHDAFESLFKRAERRYGYSEKLTAQVPMRVFKVLVLAMGLYMVVYENLLPQGAPFQFLGYLVCMGMLLIGTWLMTVMRKVVNWTFGLDKLAQGMEASYNNLWMVISIMGWPVIIVASYYYGSWTNYAWMIIGGFYGVVMLLKLIREYTLSILAPLYIVLYVCILDFIPIALIILGSGWVMRWIV